VSALNVRMSYLFDEDVRTEVLHLKTGERPSIESRGIRIESLGKRLHGQELEPFFVSLAPGSESGKRQVIHQGHEFVYCVRGQVEYSVDGEKHLLSEGDILLFEAKLPHHWRNPAQEEAELLLILQAGDSSEESVRGHFPSYPSLTYVE
jgi:quercetin dioxygenase-like cupin family protein